MTTPTRAKPGSRAKPRAPRGSYAKTEDVRAAILDAALEVFAQGGFRGGSLRLVAERVGMSEAGVLHHFSRKVTLLEAVLERRDQLSYEIVPLETVDGVLSLRGLVEMARRNRSTPGVIELFCTLSAEATSVDHPAHAYFVRRYELTRNVLTDVFSNLEERGMLRDGVTPFGAAKSTIAMMDGMQIQWLLDRNVLDMEEELRQFLREITTVEL